MIHHFNSIIKSIKNYYSGSTQQNVLNKFYFTLRKSAALTLAHRHKRKSAWWSFKKFGKDLTIVYKNKEKKELSVKFKIPIASKIIWNINSNKYSNTNDILPTIQKVAVPRSLGIICSASELSCAVPNCLNKAKRWYQGKHQKKPKVKNHLEILILSSTAKQIPICTPHYHLIHSGKYNGPSLRKIKGYTFSNLD